MPFQIPQYQKPQVDTEQGAQGGYKPQQQRPQQRYSAGEPQQQQQPQRGYGAPQQRGNYPPPRQNPYRNYQPSPRGGGYPPPQQRGYPQRGYPQQQNMMAQVPNYPPPAIAPQSGVFSQPGFIQAPTQNPWGDMSGWSTGGDAPVMAPEPMPFDPRRGSVRGGRSGY